MMSAPPPSEMTHESSLWSGSDTMGESSTSSTVRGWRYMASGLAAAWARAATAIAASCSEVVPNSNMWRAAARA